MKLSTAKVLLPAEDSRPLALGMRNLTTEEDMDIRIQETIPEDMQQMVKDIFEVSTADAKRIAGTDFRVPCTKASRISNRISCFRSM